MAKLKVMNSMIGLVPARAAPTPIPVKPISVMGVSMILFSPYLSYKPLLTYTPQYKEMICRSRVTLYAPLYLATSSPIKKTAGSRANSSSKAWFRASLTVRVTVFSPEASVAAVLKEVFTGVNLFPIEITFVLFMHDMLLEGARKALPNIVPEVG